MDQPWRIEMLGWLRVVQPDRVVTRFRTRKAGALLAYLAFHHHRSHPREQLVDLLWPGCTLAAGQRNLRTELASLRRQLEPPEVPTGAILVATRATIQLNTNACATDVALFEAALAAADQAPNAAERMQHLMAAAERYRGELLPGFAEEWVLPERLRLAEAFLQALQALTALLEQAGDRTRALHWARRATAADPLNEECHYHLIRLLVAAGQSEAARAHFEHADRLLVRELGTGFSSEVCGLLRDLPPLPETAAQQRRGKSRSRAPRPHRLATETSSATDGEGRELPSGHRSHAPRPRTDNLPPRFTRFFGRHLERHQLWPLLLQPEIRLVTMTGPGGIGKTRLALEMARRLRDDGDFRGGVWFVSLLDFRDPGLIADQVAQSLRLPRGAQTDALDQVATFLERAPALLLLDNFEHLVEGGAEIVQELLGRVEHLTVLVTSRQRLGLEGEREIPVTPLPIPAPPVLNYSGLQDSGSEHRNTLTHEYLGALTQFPSVRIFVDRAQAVRPDFQVTAQNAAAVADLCRQLEGLPLAIELAAARAGVLTPEQMLGHLTGANGGVGRFDLLVGRQRGGDPRHHSLRTALDWSYDLLTPELQRFFARLSVFRGGWTLEAAEAVCGEEGVQVFGCSGDQETAGATLEHLNTRTPEHLTLECLEQLRECSLLLAVPEGEEIRYRLLETMRQYGWERLRESGEAEAVQRRHADYFTRLAEEAERAWVTPDQMAWWDRIEREHDNMRAALAWYAETQDAEAGLRLAGALSRFWLDRGYIGEGRAHLEAMLALPGAERSKARVKALHRAGLAAANCGDIATTTRRCEQSMELARGIGDWEGFAWALHGRSHGHGHGSEESLAIFRGLNHRYGMAQTLTMLGYAAVRRGDWRTAQPLVTEGLALFREMGHPSATGMALRVMGQVAEEEGDLDTAWRLYRESLDLHRKLRMAFGVATTVRIVGHLALRRQEWDAAQATIDESLALYRELGSKGAIAGPLHDLGLVACGRRDWVEARARVEESLALSRQQVGYEDISVACLERLAEILGGEGEAERGARLLGAAEALTETASFDRVRWPYERDAYERSIAALQAALGEAAFAGARAEGRGMTLEQAVELALAGRSGV